MFRIDRNLVKLGDVRSITPIRFDAESEERAAGAVNTGNVESDENPEPTEVGVTGESPDAAASSAVRARERAAAGGAETDAEVRAREIVEKAEAKAEALEADIISKANAEAAAIVEAARLEAEASIASARERIDEEKLLARKEGYDEGAEEGRRSFDEQLEAKINELDGEFGRKAGEDDEKLKRVLEELYDERARTYEGLEKQVVGLALDIVRKVFDPSEEEPGGVFEKLVTNALKQINPEGKILIRVSPAEYERFFLSGSAVFDLGGGKVTASVLRDASLGAGDCIVDTEDATINAGLDSQLKLISLAFERA